MATVSHAIAKSQVEPITRYCFPGALPAPVVEGAAPIFTDWATLSLSLACGTSTITRAPGTRSEGWAFRSFFVNCVRLSSFTATLPVDVFTMSTLLFTLTTVPRT